ncbi:MAG: ABC transporter permease subunit [bacterium]
MRFFKITQQPGKTTSLILSGILFLICIIAYATTSYLRHKENPQDKVVPTFSEMGQGFYRATFKKDRDGEYRLLVDTKASGIRFLISVGILFLGVILGLYMGVFPYIEHFFLKFLLFFDKMPALALLPILFIIFGLGEVSKIALIVVGVFPTIALDTYFRGKIVPREQIIKGLTLGASDFEIAYRIVLPQIFPKVLDTIRLNLKSVILFLIAGESLAATVGLGYRIFVVRRYIAMDIIIPYVIWMSLLLLFSDGLIQLWIKKNYPWIDKE